MNLILRKIFRITITGLLGAILLIGAAPFYHVYTILLPALNEARMQIKTPDTEEAIHSLERLDTWFKVYPPLFCESAKLQVRGWTYLQQTDLAHGIISNSMAFIGTFNDTENAKSLNDWIHLPANRVIENDMYTRFGRPTTTALRAIFEEEQAVSAPSEQGDVVDDTPVSSTDPEAELPHDSQSAPTPNPAFIPDSFPAWAVVKSPSAITHNKSSTEIGQIKAGTILGVLEAPLSQGDRILYPCLQPHASGPSINVYLTGSDLDFHPGKLDTIPPIQQQLAVKRARILAAIYKLEHQNDITNPYTRLIHNVQIDQATLKKKTQSLLAKRDKSTGAQRIDANDELHSLRDQLAALARKEKTLRASMAEWQATKRSDVTLENQRAELQDALSDVDQRLSHYEAPQ